MDLVPLKVKIGIKPEGGHSYPNFNLLAPGSRSFNGIAMDWAKYVDLFGGWSYDKVCGHHETDEESPNLCEWWGLLLVPEAFASAAIEQFPSLCEEIDEAEYERLYDSRCAAKLPDQVVDSAALDHIERMERLEAAGKVQAPTAGEITRRSKALDPKSSEPGIRENPKKTWLRCKASSGCQIVERLRKA